MEYREEFSSFTANKPHVVSQAYVLPRSVTAMGVTQTKAGITTREILCKPFLFGVVELRSYSLRGSRSLIRSVVWNQQTLLGSTASFWQTIF
jgi:hypothetical protein